VRRFSIGRSGCRGSSASGGAGCGCSCGDGRRLSAAPAPTHWIEQLAEGGAFRGLARAAAAYSCGHEPDPCPFLAAGWPPAVLPRARRWRRAWHPWPVPGPGQAPALAGAAAPHASPAAAEPVWMAQIAPSGAVGHAGGLRRAHARARGGRARHAGPAAEPRAVQQGATLPAGRPPRLGPHARGAALRGRARGLECVHADHGEGLRARARRAPGAVGRHGHRPGTPWTPPRSTGRPPSPPCWPTRRPWPAAPWRGRWRPGRRCARRTCASASGSTPASNT
jgi:hypothetical protein